MLYVAAPVRPLSGMSKRKSSKGRYDEINCMGHFDDSHVFLIHLNM